MFVAKRNQPRRCAISARRGRVLPSFLPVSCSAGRFSACGFFLSRGPATHSINGRPAVRAKRCWCVPRKKNHRSLR